jgi:hypothetical protein
MERKVIIYTDIKDYPHLTLVTNKNASGFPYDINESQFHNFVKWKQQLYDENILTNFNYYDDYYLLKFLRARKFDLKKTMIMFKNFLEWRQKENVDNIETIFKFNERPQVKEYYPNGYHKVDKEGRPIYIELLSEVKLKELFSIVSDQRLVLNYIQDYERIMKYRFTACSKLKGERVDQTFTILCVKGIGLSHLVGKTKKFLTLATSIGQDYYPENMGVMFLINASVFFAALWNIVKGFIDEKTRKKIFVEDKGYLKKLLQLIDADNLPKILGGNCTCSHVPGGCLFSDIGPWNPKGGMPPQKNSINKDDKAW